MKTTIKAFIIAAVSLLSGAAFMTSCSDYQDEIDALDYRVTVLEKLANEVNNNVASLQKFVAAMQNYDYITNVTTDSEGNVIITFANAGSFTIKNGADGTQPPISIGVGDDGNYYWMLNGKFILVNGNKVGVNSTLPQLRINSSGFWEYSIDGGTTWIETGASAKGSDAETKILSIEMDETGKYVVIKTSDGKEYKIPYTAGFGIVYVETVNINESMGGTVTMKKSDEQKKLSVTCTPSNATYTDVIWCITEWQSLDGTTSFKTSPIRIASDGMIHVTDACKAKVRAIAKFGLDSSVYAEVIVTVTND